MGVSPVVVTSVLCVSPVVVTSVCKLIAKQHLSSHSLTAIACIPIIPEESA